VFITKYKRPWRCCELRIEPEDGGDAENGEGEEEKPRLKQDDAVAKEFIKVLKALDLHRSGLGFYLLRHTFETIGGDTGDQVAVDAIMGHVREDMASMYRERVNDERLRRVTDHVRAWLFPSDKQGKPADGQAAPTTNNG
jgi:integrase